MADPLASSGVAQIPALIAKWREAAKQADRLMAEADARGFDGANAHAFRKERRIWTTCADELEAALLAVDAPPEPSGHRHTAECYGRQGETVIGPLCGFAETQAAVDAPRDRVCPWCGDSLYVLKASGGCLTAEKHGYLWHAECADAREAVDAPPNDVDTLRQVCAEMYQVAGVLGASEKVLDNLAAAASGKPLPHESVLPYAVDAPPPQAEEPWQPIATAPSVRPGGLVLVALIRDGVIWRVSEAAFNGLGWYTKSGEACHWRTHWMPEAAPRDAATSGAARNANERGLSKSATDGRRR